MVTRLTEKRRKFVSFIACLSIAIHFDPFTFLFIVAPPLEQVWSLDLSTGVQVLH